MSAQSHQSSKVSTRRHASPLIPGWWWGIYDNSQATRITEKDGIDRLAYGEQIQATNNKVYDAEKILCSVCGTKKHYLDFNRDRRLTWRFSRRYECRTCQKHQGIDQVSRREKRHAKWARA